MFLTSVLERHRYKLFSLVAFRLQLAKLLGKIGGCFLGHRFVLPHGALVFQGVGPKSR